ncbi:TPA: hypothetical protein ACOJNU_000801 [Pseudomonas putida]
MISDLCGCTPVVTEEALRTPLLREIYDCLKEAAFTEMELVALGVMLAAKYSYAAGQLEVSVRLTHPPKFDFRAMVSAYF